MRAVARQVADSLGRSSRLVRTLQPLYQRMLMMRYRGTGIPWSLNGMPCRIDADQRGEMGQSYDAAVAAWLRERVQPGQVAWNVGANVGVYVLQLAHWVGPAGRVVAIEPNPAARAVLERHLAYNGLTERVDVVGAAAGDSPGTATLWAAGSDGMCTIGAANPAVAARAQPVTAPVTTIDALVDAGLPRPDWILMDVEGYELHALRGAERTLARGPGSPRVVVELHPRMWAQHGESAATLDALLARHGRRVVQLRGDGDVHESHMIVALEPVG